MGAITFKALVALATAALGIWALRSRIFESQSDRRFVGAVLGLQLAPALLLFAALYLVGHQEVTSDVPAYYVPAGQSVLAGQIPLRDFASSYAPLFPYVGALLLLVWSSAKVFALFAIALNALTLVLWHTVAMSCFDRRIARDSSILYATSGHALVQTLLGSNQVWIAAALAGSTLLLARERDVISGFVQALAVCTVKFLALLFWPLLWIAASSRVRWLCAAALPVLVIYGVFALIGADLLYPIRHEGVLTSPGNLPYLLEPALSMAGLNAGHVADALALVFLACTTLWLYVKMRALTVSQRAQVLPIGLAVTSLVFMLVSKKSFPGYALFCLYPLMMALLLGNTSFRWRALFFGAFNVLLAVESSIWFRLGGNQLTLSAWLNTSARPQAEVFLLVDLALVGCYAYLAWLAVRWLMNVRHSGGARESETPRWSMAFPSSPPAPPRLSSTGDH